jgi:hypothetical protein
LKAEFEDALPPGEDEARVFRFEFESEPGFTLELESLESERKGIELLNVRRAADTMFAAVLLPRGKNNNPANKSLVESAARVWF